MSLAAGWSPADLLPGLWVAALAGGLLALLRRRFDPVPWRIAAVFGLVLAALFGRVLVAGDLLLPLDSLRGEAPLRALAPTEPHGNLIQGDLIQLIQPSIVEVRRAAGAGRLPLRNDRAGAGMPLLADPQAQALAPLVLLGAPFRVAQAAGVTAALRVLLALVFGFLFLRRQGLGEGAALCGALGFGMSGFLLLWLGWPMANTGAFLPAVLYAVARVGAGGARRDLALLVAALFGLLTGGHPETIAYALLFAGAYAAVEIARRQSDGRRLAGALAWSLAVAIGLAAPVLLPAGFSLVASARAAREEARLASPAGSADGSGAILDAALRRAVPTIAPNAYGNSRFGGYWGPANTNEDAAGFAGTSLLLLAVLALAPAAQRSALERLLLVAVALAALGAFGFGRGRLSLIVAFGVSSLGAFVLDRRTKGGDRRAIARAIVLVAVLALGAAIAWAYLAHPDPADPRHLEILRFGWLRWQARFLVGTSLALLVLGGRRLLPAVIAPFVAAELWLCFAPANPPAPRRLEFPSNPAIRFLAEHADERMVALGAAFPPNLPTLYGLRDLRTYNPVAPAAWERLVAPLVVGRGGEVPRFGHPEHPLYARLGVRFLLTEPEVEISGLPLAFADATACIYEIPDAAALLAPREGGDPLTIEHRDEARVDARIPESLRSRAWTLRTTLFDDGGWRLLVDGRPSATSNEIDALLEALIPRGTERLALVYRPRGLWVGFLLAAAALGAAAARLLAPTPAGETSR